MPAGGFHTLASGGACNGSQARARAARVPVGRAPVAAPPPYPSRNMKLIANIAGALLGLAFLSASIPVLFNLMDESQMPKFEEGSYPALFMGAFAPSGYMHFVKWCELIGAILVAIPKTRGAGLLVLGPIIVNIYVYYFIIMEGEGLTGWMVLAVGALALICLIAEGRALMRFAFKVGADA
jgi:putative oxidoreductase